MNAAQKAAAAAAKKMMGGRNQLLREVLLSSDEYEIPAYQRGYQWDRERWQDFVRDIVSAATAPPAADGTPDPYWIGIMIASTAATDGGGIGDDTVKIIDGQQRIVTLICWLRALEDYASDMQLPPPVDAGRLLPLTVQEKDQAAMEVVRAGTWRADENRHLLADGPLAAYVYFRLLLHLGDEALTSPTPLPVANLTNLPEGDDGDPYTLIQAHASGATHDPGDLYAATLDRIAIFGMRYTSSRNAEAGLFDALNGKRTELEPLDYMRSALFVRLDEVTAQALYADMWKPRESSLCAVKLQGVQPGRNFPYDFLIALGEPVVSDSISAARAHIAFSRLLAQHDYEATFLEELVTEKLLPAMSAWPVVVGAGTSVLRKNGQARNVPPRLLELLWSIFAMSRQPLNPLALHIVCAWNRGALSLDEALTSLSMAESYVARWILAGWRLNNLRADIIAVMARLKGDTPVEALQDALLRGQWATDQQVHAGLLERHFYGSGGPKVAALGALLRGIERAKAGGEWPTFRIGSGKADYNVEHIYPQTPSTWEADLRRWRQKRDSMDERLHSLGNLTVVTSQHNKRVKNKTLTEKQTEATLVKAPMLHLNKEWMRADKWTRASIDQRTRSLAQVAIEHWARPR